MCNYINVESKLISLFLENDIVDPSFPVDAIKLVCVDEAHKAKGKFSYCEVIKHIHAVNQKFRVVALSATPGKTDDVIDIIRNLLISKIEVRTEKSVDVKQYTFAKEIVVEIVDLGELKIIRDRFVDITNPYIRKLFDHKVISGNINKGWIIIQQKKFQMTSHLHSVQNRTEITQLFSIVISLLYSHDLLERHGLHIFINSFKDDSNITKMKYFVSQDSDLKTFLNELNEKYGGTSPLLLNVNPLPNGNVPSIIDKDLDYGHPKFMLLKTKLVEYFNNGGTKTIIFCEFRETVMLVYTMLLQMRPKIIGRMLIGQGGAISQKDQLTVMKDFRSNMVNVLVTTSVCEEGIDVGEVDLVICFDINTKNPTRFVQRIGRTGRKRKGKVIILATEGKEEQVVKDVIGSKDKMNKSIHSNKEITKNLYRNSPRLVPGNFMPKCVETKFNIPEAEVEAKPARKTKKAVSKKKPVTPAVTRSIASHFKAMEKKLSDDNAVTNETVGDEAVNVVQNDVPKLEVAVPSIPTTVIAELNRARENFRKEFDVIMNKIDEDDEFVVDHLKLSNEKDLRLMDDLIELLLDSVAVDDASMTLNDDILLEESIKVKIKPALPPAFTSTPEQIKPNQSQLDEDFDSESRYGNQFSIPEPFNTPFKNSPFNRILNSTSTPLSTIPNLKRNSKTKKLQIEDSPLIKAFEKQRSLSSSTPVTTRSTSSIQSVTRDLTTTSSTSHASKTQEKSALEFFGLTSIEDIFEGLDEASVAESVAHKTESSVISGNSIAHLLDGDDDFLLDIVDEVVESSVLDESPSLHKNKKDVKKVDEKLDFNIDEIFGSSNGSLGELENNIVDLPSDFSQTTECNEPEVEEVMKENVNPVMIVNSVHIVPQVSPKKPLPMQSRPNFARLMNALKSPKFLTSPENKILQPSIVSRQNNGIDSNNSRGLTANVGSPSPLIFSKSPMATPKITNFLVPTPSTSAQFQSPLTSRVKKTPPASTSRQQEASIAISDDEILDQTRTPFALPIRKKISRKRKRNDFLDTQCGVEGDDSSDDDDDETLDGFIANNTTMSDGDDDQVDMQAKYLESLNSPMAKRQGNFKMPQLLPQVNMSAIFSQAPQEDDDWDLMDSFVVHDDDHAIDSEMDELEMAEQILKEKRKRAQRQKNGLKRRKVVRSLESSDDEDELGELRKQLSSNPD